MFTRCAEAHNSKGVNQMRRFVSILSLALAACGGESSTGPKTPATIPLIFKIDAQTCTGSAAIDFFVDGSIVGTENMSSGGTSSTYQITPAKHVLGAQVSNTHARVWGPFNIDLTGQTAWGQILTCA
jgi:hypothetical protein